MGVPAKQIIPFPDAALVRQHAGRGTEDQEQRQSPMKLSQVQQERDQHDAELENIPEEGHGVEKAPFHAVACAVQPVVVFGLLQLLQWHRLHLPEAALLDDAPQHLLMAVLDRALERIAGGLEQS